MEYDWEWMVLAVLPCCWLSGYRHMIRWKKWNDTSGGAMGREAIGASCLYDGVDEREEK